MQKFLSQQCRFSKHDSAGMIVGRHEEAIMIINRGRGLGREILEPGALLTKMNVLYLIMDISCLFP